MMPETVLDRGTTQVVGSESPRMPVVLADLSTGERTVALYASDMPARYRTTDHTQVAAWVLQGVERVGLDEVRRRAAFDAGYRLLARGGHVTPQLTASQEQRFPKAGRLNCADRHAANLNLWVQMSEETRARNGSAAVDGDCPCGGTRSIPLWRDEDATVSRMCPVHAQNAIRAMRPAVDA
ncbi:hypothetical protein [Streptomyces sp. NPDC059092]|uniref:hypothetical protein n=1 Tax=Streptomyces sp. NPDC059092 TaxID=3346725 RepID=UPI0036813A41